MNTNEPILGFSVPVPRSLTEPILLGGAPRTVAIALGLRLWIPGLVLWAVGHSAVVWAAKHDAQFGEVVRRHLRYPAYLKA